MKFFGTAFQTLAAAATLAAATGSDASVKLSGSEVLTYSGIQTIATGENALAVSFWIAPNSLAPGSQIVDARDASLNGILVSVSSDPTPQFIFQYQDAQVSHSISIPAADIALGEWSHVAVSLDNPAGKLFLYLNGAVAASSQLQTISSIDVPANMVLGTGYDGDLHDLAIRSTAIAGPEVAALQEQGAFDALFGGSPSTASDLLFYSAFRRDSSALPGDVDPTVTGTPGRGIGPVLTYSDQKPTLLVVGDTQKMGLSQMQDFASWMQDRIPTLDTRAVFHVGDWVQKTSLEHAPRARALIDGFTDPTTGYQTPFSLTIGNHDFNGGGNPTERNVSDFSADGMYNSLAKAGTNADLCDLRGAPMSVTGVCANCDAAPCSTGWVLDCYMTPSMSECYPQTDSDDMYVYAFEFDLGTPGTPDEQIGIVLPWAMKAEWLDWAVDIAEAHPTKTVSIVSHEILTETGSLAQQYTSGGFDLQGVPPMEAWDTHFKDIENLRFMFCGHQNTTDEADQLTGRRCLQTTNGNPVLALVVNAQEAVGGGQGYLVMLTFDGDEVRGESYVPLTDTFISREDLNCERLDKEFTVPRSDPCIAGCGATVPVCGCRDLDGDGAIGFGDVVSLTSAWGPCPPTGPCSADFNCSGDVDVFDLISLLSVQDDLVGDTNEDGTVDCEDLACLNNFIDNGVPAIPTFHYDANCDAVVDINDILALEQILSDAGISCTGNELVGDTNSDGTVDCVDLACLNNHIDNGVPSNPGFQFDANCDGVIDVNDIPALEQILFNAGISCTGTETCSGI